MATLKNIQQIALDEGDGARAPTNEDIFVGESGAGTPFSSTGLQLAQLSRESVLNPKDFGAVGDNVADDTAAIQATLDAIPEAAGFSGGTVLFPVGTYRITAGLVIPIDVRGKWQIIGYGARILTDQPITMLSRERPVDNNEAVLKSRVAGLNIEGLEIQGATTTLCGIEMSAYYGLSIKNVQVLFCERSYDLIFCLNSMVINCYATQPSVEGFVARHAEGEWTGATKTNSQSNHTKFFGCQGFGGTGCQQIFRILGSSGIELNGCITEGFAPVNSVVFDDDGSTVVREFRCVNHHSENNPSNSIFRIILVSGVAVIEQLYHQGNAIVLVDAAGCGFNARISLDRLGFAPASSQLKADTGNAPKWFMNETGNVFIDWADPANWVGGIVGFTLELGVDANSQIGLFSSSRPVYRGQYLTFDATLDRIFFRGNIYTDKLEVGATLGTVIRKLPVYDADTETFVGFVPVYDDIT